MFDSQCYFVSLCFWHSIGRRRRAAVTGGVAPQFGSSNTLQRGDAMKPTRKTRTHPGAEKTGRCLTPVHAKFIFKKCNAKMRVSFYDTLFWVIWHWIPPISRSLLIAILIATDFAVAFGSSAALLFPHV